MNKYLETLTIHKLSANQWREARQNNLLDNDAIYVCPPEDLSGFATKSEVSNKADKDHTHSDYETKADADAKLKSANAYTDTVAAEKAPLVHEHNSAYYSKAEVDAKLSGKIDSASVDNKINTHNTANTSHSDIRNTVFNLSTKLNALADSDDTTLDQLSEIVAYIKSNKNLIQAVTDAKANKDHTHNYAGSSSAGGDANNALHLQGFTINTSKPIGSIPYVRTNGVMEIGQYIDFHNSNDSKDYDARIAARSDGTAGLQLYGTTSGTFQGNLIGNAISADKITRSSTLNSTTDTDGFVEGSFMKFAACSKNATPMDNDGIILSLPYSGSYAAQLWFDDGSGEGGMAIRSSKGVDSATSAITWNPWRKVLTENNCHLYALPLTGGTLSGSVSTTNGSFWAASENAEADVGVRYKGGSLYFYGNNGTGTRGIYDSNLGGSIISVTNSGATFAGNAATATKLATARTISLTGSVTGSGTFDGSGNLSIATTSNHNHDGSYVNVTGDSMSGTLMCNTTIKDHSSPTEQCLVINANSIPSGTTLSDKNAPGIGFHIGQNSWGSLIFRDGAFKFINNAATGYMPVYASTFYGSLSGNATTASSAVGVQDYNDTSRVIQIGYQGGGATTSNLAYIAGYLTGGTKIKDVSVEVLQSWLRLGSAAYTASTDYSASGHIHDDRYYTEAEIDSKLSGKANSSHGNHVPTTQTANNAVFLRNDNTWQTVTPANIGAAAASHTHSYLPLSGGTMTDSIITPKNDNMGIIPHTDNYGQIGSAEKKFYRMYASTFYGNLSGNATTATTANYTNYINAINLPANADLNSYETPGFYYSPANATVATFSNCPTSNAFFMIVGKHAGIYQEVTEYMTSSYNKYVRNYYNGSWGSWRQISFTDHTHSYLPLSGGTMNSGARIGHGGSLYLGNENNSGWVYTQDIASQSGNSYWAINVAGSAWFKDVHIGGYTYSTKGSYALNTSSFYCQSWVRSGGDTGWYNETYGGGWYMNDTTWIRTYGGKNIYQNTGIMRTDGTLQVGADGAYFNASSSGTNIGGKLSVTYSGVGGVTVEGSGTTTGVQILRTDTQYGLRVGVSSSGAQGLWAIDYNTSSAPAIIYRKPSDASATTYLPDRIVMAGSYGKGNPPSTGTLVNGMIYFKIIS